MKLQQAQRSQVKLRIGLSGPSGYGKTYSALLLAFGITNDWSKIAVIDTENNSASLYSHLGDFNVLSLEEPYSPQRYVEALKTCEMADMEVIIVDSISHEWQGKGGCLEMHEKLGGRFQDWAKITPYHNSFVDGILQSKCHVITSTRRKVDYSLDRDMNGKTKVMKLGTKEITREGFEYELTVNFELINDNHLVKASKDRTGLFMNKPEFIINQSTGKKLKEWCTDGVSIEKIKKEISLCHHLAGLKHIYDKYSSVQKEIYPLIIERKNLIEDSNSQLIEENNVEQPKN
ncbi:AAA family ATPase [Gillisia hiemivivida]|uniref:AAA family ATPase n=1 Tax=Gillisia hiemivivida TaxID=291190 RepID=A0A5C6ZXD1_9FLAO|nr:AAA family ATPase [Gillisia hiemivivida]TXD95673.1 AAA family ATPase [Gillisia hiemivivida]